MQQAPGAAQVAQEHAAKAPPSMRALDQPGHVGQDGRGHIRNAAAVQVVEVKVDEVVLLYVGLGAGHKDAQIRHESCEWVGRNVWRGPAVTPLV